MSDVATFALEAVANARRYTGCSDEQALVYSCEDIVDREIPSRSLNATDVAEFVELVCDADGIDAPIILERITRGRVVASSIVEEGIICINRRTTNVATVLHEMAHHSGRVDDHGPLFRDELIGLLRRHLGVEYAAFLYQIMIHSGLEMSPWPASSGHRM
jgi:hypothetical protein